MSQTASGFRPAALVTDGAQPVGRALALALAQRGYAVAVAAGRSRAKTDHLVGEIVAAGGRAARVEGGVADDAAMLRLVPAAASAVGPLTLLLNNAAEVAPDENGDRARFERHIAVHLRAPILLAEAFAAQLPAGADAAIVNLLDRRALERTPRHLTYALSEGALQLATTTLAQALAPRIRVNAVAAQSLGLQVDGGVDVVDAVLYLASAASVTGATIAVGRGQGDAEQ
jgi:NAD(P)-dependent dehydrogenase (short-subunit alcohol dehydrogenase family)